MTVKDGSKLPKLVQALDIGKEATFTIWRDGETLDVTLLIGNLNKMNE